MSAVHRSMRVSAAGDALTVGELDAATGASDEVQAAVARTSQATMRTGRYRERRSRVEEIIRNRTEMLRFRSTGDTLPSDGSDHDQPCR